MLLLEYFSNYKTQKDKIIHNRFLGKYSEDQISLGVGGRGV